MLLFVCPEIWDALKVAAESDLALAQTIVDSAGIIVSNPDMTLCYDERGAYILITKFLILFFLTSCSGPILKLRTLCCRCQV